MSNGSPNRQDIPLTPIGAFDAHVQEIVDGIVPLDIGNARQEQPAVQLSASQQAMQRAFELSEIARVKEAQPEQPVTPAETTVTEDREEPATPDFVLKAMNTHAVRQFREPPETGRSAVHEENGGARATFYEEGYVPVPGNVTFTRTYEFDPKRGKSIPGFRAVLGEKQLFVPSSERDSDDFIDRKLASAADELKHGGGNPVKRKRSR